jgi:hypothetical protein
MIDSVAGAHASASPAESTTSYASTSG